MKAVLPNKNNEKTPKEQKTKKNPKKNIPFGREEVKKAILDAAEKLLLERNANEITVREIAKLANIKHPLIHRHFGTKNEVFFAVHARGIEQIDPELWKIEKIEGSMAKFFEATENNRFRRIALARAMLDGVDPSLIQNEFPTVKFLIDLLKKRQTRTDAEQKFEPEILAMALISLGLGWMLYEPFLLASTGFSEKNKNETRQKIIEIMEEIIKKLS